MEEGPDSGSESPTGWVAVRDMVFVSHANPEDNEFARWLALRLAAEGYPAWCDLTRLLGGEDFWQDAERAIRERTIKFLYVLSRASNRKEGPLSELRIASVVQRDGRLKDFIIPLRFDDLPYAEMNIEIVRRTAIDFASGWARGLQQLLEKLHEDSVPRDPRFSVQSVAEWWSTHIRADEGLVKRPDIHITNWLPLHLRPDRLYVHTIDAPPLSIHPFPLIDAAYPAVVYKRSVITCAKWKEVASAAELQRTRAASQLSLTVAQFLHPQTAQWLGPVQSRRNLLFVLLRLAWERFASSRGLVPYGLANVRKAYCFTFDVVGLKPVLFRDPFGRERRRSLIGYGTVPRGDSSVRRYWHFGVELRPLLSPQLSYGVRYHLAFSDDGRTLWDNKQRAHRARRATGRDWWNADWRDRTLAAASWLAEGRRTLQFSMGQAARIEVSSVPLMVASPVLYLEPRGRVGALDFQDEDEDEQNEQTE
jgi:hypothetical protein